MLYNIMVLTAEPKSTQLGPGLSDNFYRNIVQGEGLHAGNAGWLQVYAPSHLPLLFDHGFNNVYIPGPVSNMNVVMPQDQLDVLNPDVKLTNRISFSNPLQDPTVNTKKGRNFRSAGGGPPGLTQGTTAFLPGGGPVNYMHPEPYSDMQIDGDWYKKSVEEFSKNFYEILESERVKWTGESRITVKGNDVASVQEVKDAIVESPKTPNTPDMGGSPTDSLNMKLGGATLNPRRDSIAKKLHDASMEHPTVKTNFSLKKLDEFKEGKKDLYAPLTDAPPADLSEGYPPNPKQRAYEHNMKVTNLIQKDVDKNPKTYMRTVQRNGVTHLEIAENMKKVQSPASFTNKPAALSVTKTTAIKTPSSMDSIHMDSLRHESDEDKGSPMSVDTAENKGSPMSVDTAEKDWF
jgi:hypothetical protein